MGDWTPPMLYLRGGRYLDSRTPAATLRRASSVDQAVMARIVLYRNMNKDFFSEGISENGMFRTEI